MWVPHLFQNKPFLYATLKRAAQAAPVHLARIADHPAHSEELESSAAEDEIAAERAVARTNNVLAFTRKRPASPALPGASAARAGGRGGAAGLPVLRQPAAAEVGRGHHRDARGHPTAMEGDPARIDQLLPWNWQPRSAPQSQAA